MQATRSTAPRRVTVASGAWLRRSRRRITSVRPRKIITLTPWMRATWLMSKAKRFASLSPPWGPVEVTTVPVVTTTQAITTRRRPQVRMRGSTWSADFVCGSPARLYRTIASVRSTRESRKWVITNSGRRSKMTVSPPTTACARTPATRPSESQMRSRRRGSRRNDPSTHTITAIDTAPVNMRLTNSTIAWPPSAPLGVSRPGSQLGQSGQPRPEPVRRTAAPVTMMTARRKPATSTIFR